jgi:hypothetical protein
MSAYPITLTHPETGATYLAPSRLEMMEALSNGWTLSAEERKEVVAKTSGRRKASSTEDPKETA